MSNEIALMREIAILQNQIDALRTIQQGWQPVFLSSPLTSTSWDGDSFSTTAKTLIDLSAVFSAPAGIKAISVFVRLNDSASASANYWMVCRPLIPLMLVYFFNVPKLTIDIDMEPELFHVMLTGISIIKYQQAERIH
jgi:hypothetical protein